MDECSKNNGNNHSSEKPDEDNLDELTQSQPEFEVSSLCENNFERKHDKENVKRFGNVRKISQLWKAVRNKKVNVFQDLPNSQSNEIKAITSHSPCLDKPMAHGLLFLHSNFIENKNSRQLPCCPSSSFSSNKYQANEGSVDDKQFFDSVPNSMKQSVIEKNFRPCFGTIHTQVDYVHWLVPDLLQITNCNYYWGVMDRFEAEKVLENRTEGTFLLRDSAQEEFLFSVSFRRYSRSLHARIEQWDHKFSFDSHDSSVFASKSVCGLIEHYKDPSCCMFFEPMLTIPLPRMKPFSLQHLCRANICAMITYDGISFLPIPKSLKQFLQYYHYKQKVRVRQF